MTTVARPTSSPARPRKTEEDKDTAPLRPARVFLHTCLIIISAAWLLPLLWAAYTSLRPYEETAANGYVSIAQTLTLENYRKALDQGDLLLYFKNTMLIVVPALVLILLLSSMVAFVVSRFRFRGQVALLMLFTAGNLLPQQVIITPLYRIYREVPLPAWMSDSQTLFDSLWGIILIHVAFQIGFCTFVLSNYMKTLPEELTEAARVDGASAWRQYWQITLPLCRAAAGGARDARVHLDLQRLLLGARAHGQRRQAADHVGAEQPAGAVLHRQQPRRGRFAHRRAADVLVYFLLQKQFIGGLTLGATKG